MTSRFANRSTNINYRDNDIFNTSYNAPVALLETRDAKFPRPRSTQRAVNRPREHTNPIEQSYGRLHTWDQKEISLDDAEYFASLNKNMLKSSRHPTAKWIGGNNTDANMLTQSVDIRQQTHNDTYDAPENDIVMAQRIWKDFVGQREEYKKDLEKQISEKNKRKEIEKVVALSTVLSGLPIGEIHSGFDVDVCTRNLVVRQRGKKHPNYFERRSTMAETQVSFNESQDLQQHRKANNSLSVIKVEEVIEEDEGSSGQVLKTEPVQAKKGSKEDKYAEYLENTTNSRYHVKRVFHNKLKEYIEEQNKKCEEYTSKLLREKQQAQKNWGQEIQNQIAKKAIQKKADAFRDQKQERGDLKKKINIGGMSRGPAPIQKSAVLSKIAEKYEHNQKKIDNQQQVNSATRQKALEISGSYQRIVDDTVRRMLKKNADLLSKSQKSH